MRKKCRIIGGAESSFGLSALFFCTLPDVRKIFLQSSIFFLKYATSLTKLLSAKAKARV